MHEDRIEALKRKLAARDGKPEFRRNCEDLRAEIARLENESKRSGEDLKA